MGGSIEGNTRRNEGEEKKESFGESAAQSFGG